MHKIIDAHCHSLEDSQVPWARELGYYKICLMDWKPQVLAEALRRHGDFVVALGWLPMPDGDIARSLAAVEEFRGLGCKGFKICCSEAPYDDEQFYPIYAKAQEYGMPCFFHTGWLDQRLATTSCPPTKKRLLVHWYDVMTLDRIALDFPRLKITAYHMGNTRPADCGVLMRNHPNVYADSCTRLDEFTYASIADKRGGGTAVLGKLIFGTDGMATRDAHRSWIERMNAFLDIAGASPALRERVWYKTALRILGMDDELRKVALARKGTAADVDLDRAIAGNAGAKPVADFLDKQGERAKPATAAHIAYGGDALHMTFICDEPQTGKLVSTRDGHVGQIWQDDSIEVFLSPTRNESYYHIVVNCIGRAFITHRRGNEVRELPTPVQSKIADGRWAVQLAIPYAAMATAAPKAGDRWGLNIARNKATPPAEAISWMEIASTYHDPTSFGYLRFE